MSKKNVGKYCVAQHEIKDLNDDEEVIDDRMKIEKKYFTLIRKL